MTITEGTANPRAQGHEATNIEIDLSKGKHHTQYWSTVTTFLPIKIHHVINTSKATIKTPLTKLFDKVANNAVIPDLLTSFYD